MEFDKVASETQVVESECVIQKFCLLPVTCLFLVTSFASGGVCVGNGLVL